MNVFVAARIENRILIEEISSIYEITNPQLYKQLVCMGGAAAFKIKDLNIQSSEVDHHDKEIMVLRELIDFLTEDELKAVLAHERAHITNGDLDVEVPMSGLKKIVNIDKEIKADEAGAREVSATVMLNAIDKMHEFQVRKLFRVTSPFWIKFWTFLVKNKMYRARRKALLNMIAQGM